MPRERQLQKVGKRQAPGTSLRQRPTARNTRLKTTRGNDWYNRFPSHQLKKTYSRTNVARMQPKLADDEEMKAKGLAEKQETDHGLSYINWNCVSEFEAMDLLAQVQQGQQKKPERIHEMPVMRSYFRRHRARSLRLVKIAFGHIE